jgi:hypothetical protein
MQARRRADAPIESHGHFHQHQRPFVLAPAREAFIQTPRLSFTHTKLCCDIGCKQALHPLAGDGRVGVVGGCH